MNIRAKKPGTYDSELRDLRLKTQGLTIRKPGTYGSKLRDLRHESAIVTTRNTILMERNIVFYMIISKRIRDAAFFFIIMLFTFAATLLKYQKYVSSRTIQKCVEHVSTST